MDNSLVLRPRELKHAGSCAVSKTKNGPESIRSSECIKTGRYYYSVPDELLASAWARELRTNFPFSVGVRPAGYK
jgi:hypothetical protein